MPVQVQAVACLQEEEEEEGQAARQSAALLVPARDFGPRRFTPPASTTRRGLQLGGAFSQSLKPAFLFRGKSFLTLDRGSLSGYVFGNSGKHGLQKS